MIFLGDIVKSLILVLVTVSLSACASTAPQRCSGTVRHVNQPSVPVVAADVGCTVSRSA